MGYERQNAIIVTTRLEGEIQAAHDRATIIFGGDMVSPVVKSRENRVESFFIAPDGSKEGWPESERGDRERAAFCDWLDSQAYEEGSSPYDWIEVQYGDDNKEVKIVRSNDDLVPRRNHRQKRPTSDERIDELVKAMGDLEKKFDSINEKLDHFEEWQTEQNEKRN